MEKKDASPASSTHSSNEKERISRTEEAGVDVEKTPVQVSVYNAHVDVSGIDERKLMRKLDLALVPWLSFLYLLSFLDRTSIGNAKVRLSIENG